MNEREDWRKRQGVIRQRRKMTGCEDDRREYSGRENSMEGRWLEGRFMEGEYDEGRGGRVNERTYI